MMCIIWCSVYEYFMINGKTSAQTVYNIIEFETDEQLKNLSRPFS